MGSSRLVLMVLAAACVIGIAGCTAKEARERVDQTTEQVERTIAAKERVDAAIEALPATPDDQRVQVIRESLPPEVIPQFDAAVAKGQDVLATAKEVSAVIGRSADELLERLHAYQLELAQKQDDDDATWESIAFIAKSVSPISAAVAAVLGVIFGRKRGRKEGASVVASIVAQGRAVSTQLDDAFKSGTAHDVMKTRLDSEAPDLAPIVRQAKSQAKVV